MELTIYNVLLEHTDMGNHFEYTAWTSDGDIDKTGKIYKPKLKRWYDREDYGYWRIQLDDQSDIEDGRTPFYEFIENCFPHEINDLLLSYLIKEKLI